LCCTLIGSLETVGHFTSMENHFPPTQPSHFIAQLVQITNLGDFFVCLNLAYPVADGD
jgi:hypothetical protein